MIQAIPVSRPAEVIGRWALLATVVVPAIAVPGILFPFVSTRTVIFRVLVDIALCALLYLMAFSESRPTRQRDYFLFALLAFTGASLVSSVVGPSPMRSLFGDFERMGGVWALLHYLLFYALARVFLRPRDWELYFRGSVVIAVLLSALAIWQYVAASMVSSGSVGGVYGAVGNSGLFGIYLFMAFFAATLFSVRAQDNRNRAVWLAGAGFILTGLFLSQNRSSLLGVILGTAVAMVTFGFLERRIRGWAVGFVLTGIVALTAVVMAVQRNPDGFLAASLPSVFSRLALALSQGDPIRFIFWDAAVRAFQDRPLVGFGPENFNLAWSANFSPEIYGVSGDMRLDRAHNAFLEVLATTGALGTICFLAVWCALASLIWQANKSGRLTNRETAITAGGMAGYLFCLLFWFFDINSTFLWIASVAFIASLSHGTPLVEFDGVRSVTSRARLFFGAELAVIAAAIYLHGVETLRVGRALHRTQASMDIRQTLSNYLVALDSPVPLTSHTAYMLGSYVASLQPRFAALRADSVLGPVVENAFTRAFQEFEDERRRDPLNEDIYTHEARLALVAAKYFGHPVFYSYGVKLLEKAVALNPMRVQPRLVLAFALTSGRDFTRARAQIAQSLSINSRSGPAYYYLANLEIVEGHFEEAANAAIRTISLKHVGAPQLYSQLADSLENRNRPGRAAEVLSFAVWGMRRRAGATSELSGVELFFRGRLPFLWAAAGDTARAIGAANQLGRLRPALRPMTQKVLADLQAGKTDSGMLSRPVGVKSIAR